MRTLSLIKHGVRFKKKKPAKKYICIQKTINFGGKLSFILYFSFFLE
jgi:hypothetical protein